MGATTDRGWRASARMRLVVLIAAAALVGGAVIATRASSAGPSAGQLDTFGSNLSGALGPGRPSNDPNPGPVALPTGAGAVTRVALGADVDLAIGSDGHLYTFGDNSLGQLGRPTSGDSSPTPAAVSLSGATGGVTDAAGGDQFSVAATGGGQVYVFGDNSWGQHGDGSSGAGSNTPVQASVPPDAGRVTAVAAGEDHVLALTSTDQLLSWGHNNVGQLGTSVSNATDTPITTPSENPFLGDHTGTFAQIGAGDEFSVVLTSSGQVFTFGLNTNGQLGRTITGNSDFHPGLVSFPGLSGSIVQIAVGPSHTLALSSGGQLYAFGDNSSGQLGNGGANSATPQLVAMPAGSGPIVQIAAANDDSFALTSSGRLFAFGNNHYGQLGSNTNNGTDNPNPAPTPVTMPAGASLDAVAGGFSNQSAVIVAALAVTSTTLPAGTVGAAYSASGTVTGGRTPYSWSATALPPGLAIDAGTGKITGTPQTAGQYSPTLQATDGAGITASAQATMAVAPPAPTLGGSTTSTTSTTSSTPHPTSGGAARVSIPSLSLAGPGATIVTRCTGSAGQRCTGTITGATVEHLSGKKVVSITSAARPAAKKPKVKTRRLKVVNGSYTLAAGTSKRIAILLTKAGRALLDTFYRVPVSLSIADGAGRTTRTVTFHYTIIDATVDFYWKYRSGYTFIGHLLAEKLRSSWKVTVSCRGGGCPLKQAAVKIHGGVAKATPALQGAHLRPGAVVQLTISAREAVAEVLRFQMLSNQLPRTTALCQTPDQRAPTACR